MTRWKLALILPLIGAAVGAGAELAVLPATVRSDPFGKLVEADRTAGVQPAKKMALAAPRAAYVSCRILVSHPTAASYTLRVAAPWEVELYKEWFHYMPAPKLYYPDALIPASAPYRGQLPDPDNRIAGQTTQSFWLDIWIPAGARTGVQTVTVMLESGGRKAVLPVAVEVLPAVVPAEDVVLMDHNSYGTSWFAAQYPQLAQRQPGGFFLSDAFFRLIHAYHRVFYEHRGLFHQLGYGHGGKVGPEFAPRLEGTGKSKRVADWTYYDLHYGPLLDGSVFAGSRRGAKPIPFVYLPVNPEWPASFLAWGEAGYEREFINVMREMEAHFREKGWTHTRFELFFNHKKRYKAFHWDGDETRFAKDFPLFAEYARWMRAAIPPDSPVRWVFRADVSWQMERQFRELKGVINFWVCSGGMFGWFADGAAPLKQRGDIIFTYGGTPTVDQPASAIAVEVLGPWMLGVDGFVRWQTVMPGADPWFAFAGGGETLVYPGERFGIEAPLASIRLKLQRNVLQDLALLDSLKGRIPPATLRTEAVRRFNDTTPADWRAPRPALADTNPEEWTNADLSDAMPKDERFTTRLDAGAWERVRQYVIEQLRRTGK